MRPTRTTRKLVMLTATGLTLAGTNQLAVQAKETKPESKERETAPRRTEDTRPPTATTTKGRDDHERENDDDDDENDDDHGTVPTSSVVATTAVPTTTPATTAVPTTRPTTTAAPTTTAKPPTPTTTAAPTTTVKPPAPTTTTAKPTTTTAAPTTTTTKPAPTIRASQTFLATKIGSPIQVDTTVTNDGTASATVSVVITLSSTGALPNYLEAKAGTGAWSCSPYAHVPTSPISYTCSGTLPAKTAGVVTVSSGSNIVGTVGQSVFAGVVVNPGGIAAGAMSAYS